MKSALDQLSKTEQATLARFYDTDAYRALRKLVDIERLELAKDHVDQTDMSMIRYLSGQVQALKKLIGTLKQNAKQADKDDQQKR